MLTRRGVFLLLLVAALCGGGGYLVGGIGGRATAEARDYATAADPIAHTAVTPRPPRPLVIGDGAALRTRLAPAPAGARVIPPGSRPVDQIMDPAVDSRIFGALGLATMAAGTWIDADATEVRTTLLEYRSVAEARAMISGVDQAFAGGPAVTDRFAIPGLDVCYGYDEPAFDPDGNRRSTVLCADEEVAIVLTFYVPGTLDQHTEIAALQRQIDTL